MVLRRAIRADVDASPAIDNLNLRRKHHVPEGMVAAALTRTVAEWDALIAATPGDPPKKARGDAMIAQSISPEPPKKPPPRMSEGEAILPPGAKIVITTMTGDIIYCTPDWQPTPQEVKTVINAWRGGNSITVTFQGVNFSVLQSTTERLISTNIKKQGHLVGATTPGGQCVLALVPPDEAYDDVYLDLARAAGQIRPGGSAAGLAMTAAKSDTRDQKKDLTKAQLKQSGLTRQTAGGGGPDAQEVQQLLHWVKDSAGLAQFISYCIQNHDQARIAAFSHFYRALRQILG
jgi:hypothetical protein